MYFSNKNKIMLMTIKINLIFFSNELLFSVFNENVLKGKINSNEKIIDDINKNLKSVMHNKTYSLIIFDFTVFS